MDTRETAEVQEIPAAVSAPNAKSAEDLVAFADTQFKNGAFDKAFDLCVESVQIKPTAAAYTMMTEISRRDGLKANDPSSVKVFHDAMVYFSDLALKLGQKELESAREVVQEQAAAFDQHSVTTREPVAQNSVPAASATARRVHFQIEETVVPVINIGQVAPVFVHAISPINTGSYADAKAAARQNINASSHTHDSLFAYAIALYEISKKSDVVTTMEVCSALNNVFRFGMNYPEVRKILGEIAYGEQKYEIAMAQAKIAIELGFEDHAMYTYLVDSLLHVAKTCTNRFISLKHVDDAIGICSKYKTHDVQYIANAYRDKVAILLNMNVKELEKYQIALKLVANYPHCPHSTALILLQQEKDVKQVEQSFVFGITAAKCGVTGVIKVFDEVLDVLRASLHVNSVAKAYCYFGTALLKSGHPQAAIEIYKKMPITDNVRVLGEYIIAAIGDAIPAEYVDQIYCIVGRQYQERGNTTRIASNKEDALEWYQQALKLQSGHTTEDEIVALNQTISVLLPLLAQQDKGVILHTPSSSVDSAVSSVGYQVGYHDGPPPSYYCGVQDHYGVFYYLPRVTSVEIIGLPQHLCDASLQAT